MSFKVKDGLRDIAPRTARRETLRGYRVEDNQYYDISVLFRVRFKMRRFGEASSPLSGKDGDGKQSGVTALSGSCGDNRDGGRVGPKKRRLRRDGDSV